MATRFRKSKKVGPVRVNVGKKSVGVSVGGKVAGVSVNSKTGTKTRVSIPGAGVSYTNNISSGSTKASGTGVKKKTGIWMLVLGILFIISGLVAIGNSTAGGALTLVLGAVLLVIYFAKKKAAKAALAEVASVPVEAETSDTDENSFEVQARERQEERAAAEAADGLAPESIDGKGRRYHYKDVEIYVSWQYGGRYDGTLEGLGIKRGDPVQLVPAPTDEDTENVSVVWNGTEIGVMKQNRMRTMVLQWQEKGYPIFSAVNGLYPWHKAFFEIAFYGYVRKDADSAETADE